MTKDAEDSRKDVPRGPLKVYVTLDPDAVVALDAWIANQPRVTSRSEAIRDLVIAALDLKRGHTRALIDQIDRLIEELSSDRGEDD